MTWSASSGNEWAIVGVSLKPVVVSDVTAPADVTDLATGTVTASSVQLSWTAPGDDGATGTATTYDVRYSTSTITAGNWGSATPASGEPSPQVAGSSETFTVTGLSTGTTYYFAIKTSDEVPNESAISNVPSGTTGDVTYQQGDGQGSVSDIDDAKILEASATTNYGSTKDLLIDASPHEHTVIKFPNIFGGGANQIPLGSTIISATLTGQVYNGGDDMLLYQLIEGWVEASVTWNEASTGVSWTNAGADGTGSHKATSVGTLSGVIGSQSIDVTTSVQNWSFGELNEGWLLKHTGTSGLKIRSSDYETAAERPRLTVTYAANTAPTVASAIPDTTVAYSSPAIDNYRDLKAVFTDTEDGSALTYSMESNTNTELVTATIIPADSTLDLSFTASTSGTATITIRATDSGGLFVEDVFTVTVSAFAGNKQTGFAWSDDVASFTSNGDDVSLAAQTGTVYVLGIQVAMTAGTASADWVLQVREDGAGSWLPVAALGGGESLVWYTEATHTFSKVNGGAVATGEFGNSTAPTGFTAVAGEFGDDNNGTTYGASGTDIYTELQYTVRATGAAAGHTYEFRILYNALVLDLYDTYATTATVTTAPAVLLGRYWFNEAPSGQAPPTTVLDDQASPVNLSVTYDTLAWRLDAGHRGLGVPVAGRINNLQHAGIASASVEGTKYKTTLDGATAVTFVVVAEWEGGWSDRVAGFGRPNAARILLILTDAGGGLEFRTDSENSNPRMIWPAAGWDDAVRHVFHFVYDTDNATDSLRMRLYVDGVDQGIPGEIPSGLPSLGDGLNWDFTDIDLIALNEQDFTNGFPGTVFYMAVYDGVMTDAAISADHLALIADDDNITYAVDVTLDGVDSLPRLPSNGTAYSYKYTVTNNSSVIDDFDLLGFPGDTLATFLTVDSITGPNVTQGATLDSARITGVPASSSDSAFVWYTVANAAAGTLDSLYLDGRSISNTAVSDSGSVFIQVVKPNMTMVKAVSPNGTQLPGTDLTYTVTITNDGSEDAVSAVIVDSLPGEVEFKVGTVVNNLPTGVTATVEYSNDGASTWTYTPVSAGCSAPTSYDGCVTHIRWTLQNNLSSVGPDNTGNVQFVARIT